MAETITTEPITLAFPKTDTTVFVPTDTGSKALAIPEAPAAPAVVGLTEVAVSESSRSTLSCSALLQGETRARAQAEALDLFDELFANQAAASAYGQSALDGVNRLVDRLLHEKQPVQSEEVRAIMKDLSRSMRGVGAKYDPSDPKVLEKYEQTRGKIKQLFKLGKTFIEEFLDDISSLETKFDKVIEGLNGHEQRLLRNVVFYDEFYQLNEQEIIKLIYAIGVMELIRDEAARRAEAIPVGDANQGDRGSEKKAKMADFVTFWETKIASYKGRLWVAWSMAPQIRMLSSVSKLLAQRINETVHVGIPTMKATIVVWNTMTEAQRAAQVNAAVEEIINNALQGFARAAAVTVPMIAQATQTPSLHPETVTLMAQSVADQAEGIVAAIELGVQKRAELDQAMLEGQAILVDATNKVSEAQIARALQVARESQAIEVATSVPAA